MQPTRVVARAIGNRLAWAAVTTAALLAVACHEDVLDPLDAAHAFLTVFEAVPQDGNGELTPGTTVVTYTTNQGVDDLDKLAISGTDSGGGTAHDLEIYWNPETTEVRLVQHFWGPVSGATSGATRCAAGTANACNQATMSVDADAKTLAFDGTQLADLFGGDATSTLSGFVRWGEDQSNGGDH